MPISISSHAFHSLILIVNSARYKYKLDDCDRSVEVADGRVGTNTPEAGHSSNKNSLTLGRACIDRNSELDRCNDIAELRAHVGGSKDVPEGSSGSLACGNAKGGADVVNGLDIVGRGEGQGEGGAWTDGGGRGKRGDDGAGR